MKTDSIKKRWVRYLIYYVSTIIIVFFFGYGVHIVYNWLK